MPAAKKIMKLLSPETIKQIQKESPFLKLGDIVYRVLESGILSLDLPPRSKLKINTIADKLGVSATPVREAFEKLEEGGLIIASKGKDSKYSTYTVFDIDDEDVKELFATRKAIESTAAYICAQKNWAVDFDYLEKTITDFTDGLQSYIDGRTIFVDCSASDRAFHETIVKSSGNKYLYEAYLMLDKKLSYLTIRTCEFVAAGQNACDLNALHVQHNAIVQAIKMGFPELAREAASSHIDFCVENSITNRHIQAQKMLER